MYSYLNIKFTRVEFLLELLSFPVKQCTLYVNRIKGRGKYDSQNFS